MINQNPNNSRPRPVSNGVNSFFEQLKKETQHIRLSMREREGIRCALEEAMHRPAQAGAHPLTRSPIRIIPSPFLFIAPRLMSSLAFVLILAVAGSGTAYAAEAAVPGDVLYPVKVRVNEPLRAALALSSEAKATWHAEAAERRMKEAEVLAARGTLTTDVKVELEENFDTHATEVEAIVEAFGDEDPVVAADISTRLGSSIAAHSAVIARLGERGEDEESRSESKNFVRTLKERGKRIASAERGLFVKAERGGGGEIAVRTFSEDAGVALSASITIRDDDAAVVARHSKKPRRSSLPSGGSLMPRQVRAPKRNCRISADTSRNFVKRMERVHPRRRRSSVHSMMPRQ